MTVLKWQKSLYVYVFCIAPYFSILITSTKEEKKNNVLSLAQ